MVDTVAAVQAVLDEFAGADEDVQMDPQVQVTEARARGPGYGT